MNAPNLERDPAPMDAATNLQHDDLGRWRAEIRSWLEEHVPDEPLPDPESSGARDEHRAWERTLYEAGYAAIHWPKAYGGHDADIATRIVFQEEYERAGAPPRLNVQGLMLAGPTLMRYGTPEQCERWIDPILRCEEVWCQGFSEPEAGSDLAALKTTAVRDGDDYVLNGQKIWTSGALHSDWMFALVRTNPEAPKHKGITWIMVDMRTPGVEVRPIEQINGHTGFCEVFMTDARVPAANVVGEVDDGWRVAMTALGFERGVGRRTYVKFLNDLTMLRHFVLARDQQDDAVVREELGRLFTSVALYRHHVNRTVAESRDGKVGPEASYNKLYWSEMQTDIYEVGMRVLGPLAELQDDTAALPDIRRWQDTYWYSRATRLFAGTNQIQKNIISERVLGLPKEPRR